MRGSRNFVRFFLSSAYFTVFKGGGVANCFIAEKLYLCFTKDPDGSTIFQGVQLFPGGGGLNATYNLFSRGGGPNPLTPS